MPGHGPPRTLISLMETPMLFNLDSHPSEMIAAIDDHGQTLSYGRLRTSSAMLAEHLQPKSLVFSFCGNSIGSLIGYASFLSNGQVPLMLDANQEAGLTENLIDTYHPSYLWLPVDHPLGSRFTQKFELDGYRLVATELPSYPLNDQLALLITTSGSTGSPKLVRQSRRNLVSNASAIAEYLEISSDDRPISTLPMNYVYGLSVINSHFLKGATLLLTSRGVVQKEFWAFFREQRATSMAGVPYTYEILKKLRFLNMELPSLRTLTQAGGKLLPDLHRDLAEYALKHDKRFVVMYGAAEATARMGYLPADKALEKCGAMGRPIPGGRFSLLDESNREINRPGQIGELIYYGDNVALGYAEKGEDLIKGDEWQGRLATGDLVMFDKDGFYYVTGRKKRFLKIFGNRIGLDETERLVKSGFPDLDCACCGQDDLMTIFITDASLLDEVRNSVALATRLHPSAFMVRYIESLPKNEAGKTLYAQLDSNHGH